MLKALNTISVPNLGRVQIGSASVFYREAGVKGPARATASPWVREFFTLLSPPDVHARGPLSPYRARHRLLRVHQRRG